MATFRYRAATAAAEMKAGVLEASSVADAMDRLRSQGLRPIEAVETAARARTPGQIKPDTATRQALAHVIGELSVLLGAGLTLDRALAVCVDNIQKPNLKAAFAALQKRVKEGAPLARAMAEGEGLFSPMAVAMAESGEANGRLDVALGRLAETLDRAEALRQTVVSSLVYPALLIVIATGVILVMMLVVVPQFEGLLGDAGARLPFMTRAVLGVSRAIRGYGWMALIGLVAAGFLARQWMQRPQTRVAVDRGLLKVWLIGPLINRIETARFARTLGSLVDGGVPLPMAMGIAQKALTNGHMAAAVGRVASGLKEGGGLSGPLGATGLFSPMTLSFLRTGEETAQLGPMLYRLADVLDREVRNDVQRIIAVLTPAITVLMGAIVATVIASIMSAILGFNDLALAP